MKERLTRGLRVLSMDWLLCAAILPLLLAGLVTMYSFTGESYYFQRQLLFIGISFFVFFGASMVDWRFLKRSLGLFLLYLFGNVLLVFLFIAGHTAKGALSWFSFGGFSFQPADLIKVLLIVVLAKYFSRRHVEIADVRHIIVSGIYALIPFVLVMLQPDFGTAAIIFVIWLGMVVVSGVSKKHLAFVAGALVVVAAIFWLFVFAPYQKERVLTFLQPLRDTQGAGYNAIQSQIAVGSGQIFGKGMGYGTQSRLRFLPEYQTDFVFAAFAEEWGFTGVLIVFVLYGIIISRLLANAMHGASNFETLFILGVAVYFMGHLTINIGMNIGLLPVTGIPLPFMSYGGSHLLAEFLALGMVMGMSRYGRPAERPNDETELLGHIGQAR
ncbi:MAG: rod shape-determining protein RodA [Candidatus Vogelbacteria bacterium CG10_big_fil_rev_8_21_14_0_10_45_14]|uniref:Rod shape-determining protein RodA n=1 Tax=Candidatus Vogelbacteria bacterium CG10_big_fil_rev_8_21_14_0_10_45_14 TaxID=1975042 RepID=A0A2H0RK25_9BACT|nr:MAG: rod shape-determining protein RodA [Candidatus Vogelbacteria bacterium CG10_big_fil_rev_8_21_14_0_10_45_14]